MTLRGATWRTIRLGLALLVGGSTIACARWTDRKVQRAWTRATNAAAQSPAAPGTTGEDAPRGRRRVPPVEAWARVDYMLERAIRILSRSPDEGRLAQLASRWCTVEPEPQVTEHGLVQVCEPRDEIRLEGLPVILEIGSTGVMGWVVRDASDDTSVRLLATAREQSATHCLSPFRSAEYRPTPADHRREEFEICPVEGGSTLAIGRIPNPGAPTWQVTLAVVGAH